MGANVQARDNYTPALLTVLLFTGSVDYQLEKYSKERIANESYTIDKPLILSERPVNRAGMLGHTYETSVKIQRGKTQLVVYFDTDYWNKNGCEKPASINVMPNLTNPALQGLEAFCNK